MMNAEGHIKATHLAESALGTLCPLASARKRFIATGFNPWLSVVLSTASRSDARMTGVCWVMIPSSLRDEPCLRIVDGGFKSRRYESFVPNGTGNSYRTLAICGLLKRRMLCRLAVGRAEAYFTARRLPTCGTADCQSALLGNRA